MLLSSRQLTADLLGIVRTRIDEIDSIFLRELSKEESTQLLYSMKPFSPVCTAEVELKPEIIFYMPDDRVEMQRLGYTLGRRYYHLGELPTSRLFAALGCLDVTKKFQTAPCPILTGIETGLLDLRSMIWVVEGRLSRLKEMEFYPRLSSQIIVRQRLAEIREFFSDRPQVLKFYLDAHEKGLVEEIEEAVTVQWDNCTMM